MIKINSKLHIKDVFDIDKMISEHGNKILLLGGVGSGKSTWVTKVLSKKGSVLFVTSRKAKVLEDIQYSSFSEVFNWNTADNQTLITNAKLASLIERIADDYMKDLDEFIKHFDYIVIDEVHSIATDSAYAESCASVFSFIEYVANIGKTIICMTGTPEPIQKYFNNNNWYTADFIDVCDYVHPKRISLIQKQQSISYIKQNIESKKIIYFANHLDSIISLCKELLDKKILSANEIAISVSKGREKKFFKDLCNLLTNNGDAEIIESFSKKVYENILLEKRLPEDCKILFSSSVLKEGINIKNSDMVMFCENHILSNLIQYFGRAREGGTEVYVIKDSNDHTIAHNELLYKYAIDYETEAANNFYIEKIEYKSNPFSKMEQKQLTEHVTKNPYIYFDYIKNQYKVFGIKYDEEIRLKNILFWDKELLSHCKRYGIKDRWFENNAQKTILLEMAEKKQIFWDKKEKSLLQNLIYVAYGIKAKQPQKINELLEEKGAPIRILNGKGNTIAKRGISFWQVLLVDDYELMSNKK